MRLHWSASASVTAFASFMYVWHQIQEHKSLHVTFAYTREVLLHVATWALTNRRIDISKWHDTSPLTTFTNKSEHTLSNDILTQGRGDHRLQLAVFFSSVFAFISHWDFHVMTLRELTGYTWKSRRVTCSLPWTMLQRIQVLMTSFTPGSPFLHVHVHALRAAKPLYWKAEADVM